MYHRNDHIFTSLVIQWLRVCLTIQGTWVQSLVQKDSTCCRITKPVHHNRGARAPQLEKPAR